MAIKLADGLVLPDNAATQVYAFMGRRGSGKTYGAGRFAEQLLDAGHQVVVLDPVGVWWGLRLAADGKAPGYEIPVFGGIHGDLALEATAGKVVAELVAEGRTSLILDVSDFTQAEQGRFVADFANELFAAKKRHRSALMVILDEAQDFCPQNPGPSEARMLGAVQRMAKLGRNFGIGMALLSQRPQEVAKKVLNLSEVLLAFQLNGTHERKAISGWVQEKGEEGRADVGLELPSLPVGTAMVWSPQWLGTYGQFKILPKRTYDASATPDQASSKAGASLAPIDLKAVEHAMAATIEQAKANDPKELKAEIDRLRGQVAAEKREGRFVGVPVLSDQEREEVLANFASLRLLAARIEAAVGRIPAGAPARLSAGPPDDARAFPLPPPARPVHPSGERWRRTAPAKRLAAREARAPKPGANGEGIGGGPAEVLLSLAGVGGQATKRQLATLAGYRPSVSTLRNYLAILRGRDLIEVNGDEVTITAAGRALAGHVEPKSPREILAMWRERLKGKPSDILGFLAAEHGPFTKEFLQGRCNVPPGKSTMRNYLAILRSNGLVLKTRGGFVINPLLKH